MTTSPSGFSKDRGALTGAVTGVAFVGAIVGAMRLAKGPIPRPGAPASEVRQYYSESRRAVRFSVAGQLVSILCLLRFSTSVARLGRRPGAAGDIALRRIAAGTGAASAAALTASAATHAYLTTGHDLDDERVRALARRVFVAGGPVHGVIYGVFVASLALLGRRASLWHRPTAWVGLGSGLAGLLSPAYFRWESAGWLIPIGRFSGYAISAIAGVKMARRAPEGRPRVR